RWRAAIRRTTAQIDVGGRNEVGAGAANVGIDEASQVHSLGPCKVEVPGPAGPQLLFITNVGRVDARVRIVSTEHSNAGPRRRRSSWRRIVDRSGVLAEDGRRAKRRAGSERLLLNTVGGNSADLGKHILASVENTPARTKG